MYGYEIHRRFQDSNGNKVYVPLTEQLYTRMTEEGGYQFNPTKQEFKSILETFIAPKKAEAAIAYLTGNYVNCAVSATSCTWSFDSGSTGSDRMLIVAFEVFKTTDTVTSATYNGSALTDLGTQASAGAGASIHLFALASPTTGSNNLVLNMSSADTPQMRATVYTGMSSSFPDATAVTDLDLSTTQTTTITTNADNAWTIKVWGNSSCGGADTASGGTATVRVHHSCSGIMDSGADVTPAGSASLTINSGSGSTWFYSVMSSFAPAGGGGGGGGSTGYQYSQFIF